MRHRYAAILLPLFTLPLLAGCPTEPPPRAKEPVVPEDAWSRLAPSREWLHATSDFNGGRAAECERVLAWVKGEAACKATLCEHGRVLATEWLARCPRFATESAVSEVTAIGNTLAARASQKATACGEKLEPLLQGQCGEDRTCQAAGQTWVTRCGKGEGSPLAVRLLERAVERKLPEPAPVKLDTRSCDDLRADLAATARCKDRYACAEALPKVEAYRARCEGPSERPTLATAVAELAVIVGAEKPGEPILIRQDMTELKPGDVAVPLADGSGGVLMICDERASDLPRYLAARKSCQGGRMVVARAFKVARGLEVRTGALDFPDDATFSARYPTILAAKEAESRAREERMAFEAALAKAAQLGRAEGGAVDSARALLAAMNTHAAAVRRSAELRAELSARDEALAPALAEIGRAKAAAVSGKVTAADVFGLLQRAQTRPFADVTPDGTGQIGVATPASRIDTAALMPKAMPAYLAALKKVRPRKLENDAVKAAKAEGLAAAARCGEAERQLQDAKQQLITCSFGLQSCDAGKAEALIRRLDEARGAAEAAYHALDLALTSPAAEESGALLRAADAASCREPWW